MENQVKRQRKINITNSPPAWGTPSRRGRTKENLTHFFEHYQKLPFSLQKGGVYNSNVLNDGSETIAERDLEAVSRLIDVLPGQHIDG